MKRREFIVQSARAAAATAVIGGGVWLLGNRRGEDDNKTKIYSPKDYSVKLDPSRPALAAARGEDWRAVTAAAIAALGGIETFVSTGDYVCIKPNIGWDRTPELGANTHPDVVSELIELCRKAGAGKVVVVDVTCNSAQRTYNRSGIKEAAERSGAEVIIPGDNDFTEVDFGPESLGK